MRKQTNIKRVSDKRLYQLPKAKKIAIIREASNSSYFYFVNKVLDYPDITPQTHGGILDTLQYPDTLILIFRGALKTTSITIGYVLWRLVQTPSLRVLITAETIDIARSFLREIKHHIEQNTLFRSLYGDLRTDRRWTDSEIIIKGHGNTKEPSIRVVGVGGNVVGSHYDLIINDDIVNRKDAESPAHRYKKHRWFADLYSVLEPQGQMITIGTRWHFDDLYATMLQSGRYIEGENLIVQPVYNDDGTPYFPAKLSIEEIEKRRKSMPPDIFSAQYLLQPLAKEDQIFRQFEYYDKLSSYEQMEIVGFCDPSLGKGKESDYTAIISVGRERSTGKMYVLPEIVERMKPDAIVDAVVQHLKHYPHTKFKVEANGFQELLYNRLKDELRKAGIYVALERINHSTNKETRIKSLSPLVNDGTLLFPQSGAEKLLEQLQDFPVSAHDDAPDALEGAVAMLTGVKEIDYTGEQNIYKQDIAGRNWL